jgi:hypothetical protein
MSDVTSDGLSSKKRPKENESLGVITLQSTQLTARIYAYPRSQRKRHS